MANKKTVVLGASPKPERFSNKALRMLRSYGHDVIPVNPGHSVIEGLPVVRNLADIHEPVDTVTVYLSPNTGEQMAEAVAALKPKRVILNPGAESDTLEAVLESTGIEVLRDCTLVMLETKRF